MSEEATLYGCIVGTHGTAINWYGLYPLNKAVIDALPQEDGYPPQTRSLFAVPVDNGRPRTAFYRSQMIHFGASFNPFSEDRRPPEALESLRMGESPTFSRGRRTSKPICNGPPTWTTGASCGRGAKVNGLRAAWRSCHFVRHADQSGRLAQLLDLNSLSASQRERVLIEGWLLGVVLAADASV